MAGIDQPGPNTIVNCLVSLIPETNIFDTQCNDQDICKAIEMKTNGFPNPLLFACKCNDALRSL